MTLLMDDQIDAIIRNALVEDVGSGDVTTLNTIPADANLAGELLVKADGVIAGLEVFHRVFDLVDPRVKVTLLAADGDRVRRGDVIATITGPGRAILTGERLALNILQRMSGIATETRPLRRRGGQHACGHPGHTQDRARPAGAGQAGGASGRWAEPPLRPL